MRLICAELGIRLLHTGVRDCEAKGVIERWHRTWREEVGDERPKDPIPLEDLNAKHWAWLAAEYHARVHDTTYLRELQRSYDLAIVVTHHSRKNGPAGAQAGQGLRGSGDLHAWGDSNLYLRRTRDTLTLTIEHRAASAPDPFNICLVVDQNKDAHLELNTNCTEKNTEQNDIEAAVLSALQSEPLSRTHLRSIIQIRNEKLKSILTQLSNAGRIVRHDDKWTLNKSQ